MAAVLLVGDLHFSDKAPSSRRETYSQEILRKLRWIVNLSNDIESSGPVPVVLAGDVFHLKTPWRTSYRLIQQVHAVLERARAGVWVVPGNHDLSGDNLDSLDSQPLGALCRMGNVSLLMGEDDALHNAAQMIVFGIPYLREYDGGDWQRAMDPWAVLQQETYEDGGVDLCVTHAPIFPPRRAPNVYASIDPEEWATYWGEDITHTYYGHIHDSHGVYTVAGHTFCNNGAISRGSLHESVVNRQPAVTLFRIMDEGERGFDTIHLPVGTAETDVVRPAHEVFLFTQAAENKALRTSATAFTDALGTVELPNLTTEEVIVDIRAGAPTSAVLAMVEDCLEVAGGKE